MYALRDYQEDANEAVRFGHQEHDSILIELATGLGKTVMFTKYASQWENGRTLVIAPLITLIGQAAKKIEKETGEFPAIEQAENWSDEDPFNRARFVVASKQTLCSGKETKRYERFQGVGLVIIDECHYACTEAYAELIKYFKDQGAKILGVTATAKRHDKRALEQVFDVCCYQMGIREAIDDGWLVPIKVTCKQLENLDLSDVQVGNTFLGKDFNQKQLAEKLEDVKVIYEITEAIAQETRGEKTAVFCASVDEAQAVSELLKDKYKINSDWICADNQRCTKQRRHDMLTRFANVDDDSLTHCCNVGILCLDEKTEILTDDGWTGIDEMTPHHKVANWHADCRVEFETALAIHRRDRLPDEKMVSASGKRIDIRITGGHDVVYRTGREWRKRTAIDCTSKAFRFPVSGVAQPMASWEPPQKTINRRRLEVKTAWNLREYNDYSKMEPS